MPDNPNRSAAVPLIFMIMPATPLQPNSEFTVGENKLMGYVISLLFLALFAYGVYDAARRHFRNVDYQSYLFALAIIPAIISFRRARSNRVYIRINRKGIFHHGKLVTGWADFLNARIDQEHKRLIDIRDNFVLVVEFRKPGNPRQGLRKKIPLTNSQDKSEEEVLAAVRYFWRNHKISAGV